MDKSNTLLSGINVLDMGSASTGPVIASKLGAFGANAVRVESNRFPDIKRRSLPYKDGRPGINRGAHFNMQDHSKYSIDIDLTKERSREVVDRLAAWADIVIQTLSPGSRRFEEFDYERFKKVRPDVIYMNATLTGNSGPKAAYKGLGQHAAGMSGFYHLIGWPDREPVGHPVAYTDFLAIHVGTIAAFAALDYRRRTGRGQFIELSAYEIGISGLRHVILDYFVNGHNQGAIGNRSDISVPHGIYPCQGQDRWCAISVSDDNEWAGLCRAMGNPAWCEDIRFTTATARKANEDDLDRRLSEFTAHHTPEEVRSILQQHGVPAGVVNNCRDIAENNPYVKARGLFWSLDHPEVGRVWAPFAMPRLSKTPAKVTRRAPLLGENTEYVCRELLKMSDDEFISLVNEGVLM